MPGEGIQIGRLAGIPISIHPLWLLIVALITFSLGQTYYPDEVAGIDTSVAYLLGLISALLLFASILLHELGHALVARRYGVEIEGIQLWLLGGVARMRGAAERPAHELRYALAGPAVTLAIFVLFGAVALALPASTPDEIEALIAYQALVNGMILAFNLMPAFPLDGGRVLRALLWWRSDDLERATIAAARVGRLFGYWLIGLGVVGVFLGAIGLLWLSLIGFFVIVAGQSEQTAIELQATFGAHGLRTVIAAPAVTLDAEQTLAEALSEYFAPLGYHAFPVLERGRPVGLLTIDQVSRVPASRRERTSVGELAERDPEVFVDPDLSVEQLLQNRCFQRHRRVAVLLDGDVVGILSVTGIERAMRARRMLAEHRGRGAAAAG